MTTLLRGRGLYIGLGVLVLILYWRLLSSTVPAHDALKSSAELPAQSLEWWPQDLTPEMLGRLAQQAPPLALVLSLVSLLLSALGLAGLLFTFWALWTGRIRAVWRFRSKPLPAWSFGELARVVLLSALIASLLPFVRMAVVSFQMQRMEPHLWIALSMLFLDGFVVLTILAFAVGKGRSLPRTLGFSPGRIRTSVAVALRSYVGVFPWMFLLLFAVVEVARRLGIHPPAELIHELIFAEDNPRILALTVFLACVVGPVAEELFFRGVVHAALRRRMGRATAMLLSSAFFALVHTNPVGFLPIMALGCLLANTYERTGSLAGPLVVHVFHNSLLMGMALLVRQLMALS